MKIKVAKTGGMRREAARRKAVSVCGNMTAFKLENVVSMPYLSNIYLFRHEMRLSRYVYGQRQWNFGLDGLRKYRIVSNGDDP